MSFTRQLSEMSASELNDAIDDTNFPQAHVLSRGRNNSVCSTSSTSGTSSLIDRNLSQADEVSGANAVPTTNPASSVSDNVAANETALVPKANRPKLVLKTNGIINENETTRTPITPMTPRTSTTPGEHINLNSCIYIYFLLFFNNNDNIVS